MGSQVQCKSHFPGYFSMRDLNEDSNSSNWPLFYGDKSLIGGQFYNGYMPRSMTDACAEYDKDTLKQKILEHEAIFRNQVYELHRLYRIQRDMMEDIRKKELHKRQTSIEPSSSSSLRGSHIPHGDTKKWQFPRFPLANSGHPMHSMSGVDIVSSPMSCKKGGNVHASGSTSKDCEVLECRPSKVRKKLFDLQLPADEYLDTAEGEPFHGSNMSNVISSLDNGDKTGKHEKLFLNGCSNGGRIDWQRDVSTSGSCQRSSTRLADLNEPFLAEDGLIPLSVDCLLGSATNHGERVGLSNSVNPNAQFLGMQKENVQNVHRRNWDGTRDGASVSHKGKGRDWLCEMYESGPKHNNMMLSTPDSLTQDQQPLCSKPLEVMLNKGHHQSSNIHPTDHSVADFWGEKTARTSEAPDRIHDHRDSVMTSQAARPSPYMNPSELTNSWSHSAFSWGKPTGSLTENPGLFHVYPSMNNSSTNLGKPSQSSPLSHSILGEKWQSNGRSSVPPGSVDLSNSNGFYHGSSSGSKEMLAHHPSIRFSHLGCNLGEDNNHKPEVVLKGVNYRNVKPFKDMDLNVVHSRCLLNEEIFTRDVEIISEKRNPEACLESLPWLRAMPSCRMKSANVCRDADSEGFNLYNSSPSKDFSQVLNPKGTATSSEFEYHAKETADENSVRKILGISCFDKISVNGKVTSSSVPTSVTHQHEEMPTEGKRRVIDINLACEEVEEEIETEFTRKRNRFDLNSCIDEDVDEVPIESSFARQTSNKKIVVDIDLQAPPVVDINDDLLPEDLNHEESLQSVELKPEQVPDDLAQLAAEAIMSLSSLSHPVEADENICQSSGEDPLEDSLVWFSDAICAFSNTNKQTSGEEKGLALGSNSRMGMDEFEIMTLQLEETKEEDYMPQPFVHEVEEMEETCGAKSVANRGRRGQTRRGGRQRRDFQRDILPGLASLSRQEVTEDIQTFSGLMKATGQTWSSGSTRRNGARNGNGGGGGGGGRGRRRRAVVEKASSTVVVSCTTTPLVQQLTSIEASLEGWGKTTRRPRRQRCPPGNLPPAVPLT